VEENNKKAELLAAREAEALRAREAAAR
jgi:hypothetical protein